MMKAQCRIEQDFHDEDDVLELYGDVAEETVLNALNRNYENVMEMWGKVPAPVVQASLMLVDLSYQHRATVSPQNMYIVPYTFDLMIKPYMRLTDNESNTNQYGCKNL